jgi:D-3-phosphoglycerate dehydrogenase
MATNKQWLIGITDYLVAPAHIEQQAFPEAEFVFLRDWRASEQNRQQWQRTDALLVWHWPVDQQTVDILDQCKIVVRYGVGYDLVDSDAVTQRDLPLCNTPDYGTEEVADTACAMILMLQRKIREYDQMCRHVQAGWQENLLRPHQRTSSQTLGIIGMGRIGTAVALRMKAFGYRIMGYDPYQPSGHEKAVGYERAASLHELLQEADIVSIHCPLTDETRAMVNAEFLQSMKKGASLVNTARGGIMVDLDCIEQALRTHQLHAVAMDVLPDEPPQAHSLITAWRNQEPGIAGRIIINPHTAYYSEQGWVEMRYKAAETVRMYLHEGKLRNRVN